MIGRKCPQQLTEASIIGELDIPTNIMRKHLYSKSVAAKHGYLGRRHRIHALQCVLGGVCSQFMNAEGEVLYIDLGTDVYLTCTILYIPYCYSITQK